MLPCRPDKYASLPWLGFRLTGLVKRWHRAQDLKVLKNWSPDVVVLERELFSDSTIDVEQSLRSIVRHIVLDIDDGLFVLNRPKFEMLCGLSDHVIAGNELLAARVRPINTRVTVIPTCVDVEKWGKRNQTPSPLTTPSSPFILGWTGTAANIPYLEILREPLKALSREFDFELRIIAECDRPLQKLGFANEGIRTRFVRWSERTEIADLQAFDIGLMPMLDNEWTRYKCGLKILQYMALGIPAVASPVGVNSEIIRHRMTGWLATTPDEWQFVLRDLMNREADHSSILDAARKQVDEKYSVAVQLAHVVACLEAVCAEQ